MPTPTLARPDGRRRRRPRAGGLRHPVASAVRDALVAAQCFGRAHLLRLGARVPIPPPTAAPRCKEPTRASSLRDDACVLLASRGGVDDFMISLGKGRSQGGLGARSAGKFGRRGAAGMRAAAWLFPARSRGEVGHRVRARASVPRLSALRAAVSAVTSRPGPSPLRPRPQPRGAATPVPLPA